MATWRPTRRGVYRTVSPCSTSALEVSAEATANRRLEPHGVAQMVADEVAKVFGGRALSEYTTSGLSSSS
jgi:hypothetical protein